MDPVSLIVMAIAAGAAAGLKPAAEQAVRDAYAGIKGLIQRKYSHVDLAPIEQKPESDAKRASLKEDLEEADAAGDPELLKLAEALAKVVQEHDAGAAAAIGVDLENVTAVNLRIDEVESEGTGVRVKQGKFEGDINIGKVKAGGGGQGPEGPF